MKKNTSVDNNNNKISVKTGNFKCNTLRGDGINRKWINYGASGRGLSALLYFRANALAHWCRGGHGEYEGDVCKC